MIIERVYRDCDDIVVVISGLPDSEPSFPLQTIPNANWLIDAIKSKVASLGEPGHTPPEDPFLAKFELLKQTLEGLDIGD